MAEVVHINRGDKLTDMLARFRAVFTHPKASQREREQCLVLVLMFATDSVDACLPLLPPTHETYLQLAERIDYFNKCIATVKEQHR